jgi:hypothetical protein
MNSFFRYVLLGGTPGIQQIKHWGFTKNDTAGRGLKISLKNLFIFCCSTVDADWNADSITDYTIYRPSTGYWYIMLSRNPILQIFMQWGVPLYNDVPV